jgi:hypothetical protein
LNATSSGIGGPLLCVIRDSIDLSVHELKADFP